MSILFFALFVLSLFYAVVSVYLHQGLKGLRKGENRELHRVSILIAARNEEKLLPRCLESVMAQDYPADRLEVIVADDRSTDGTSRVVEGFMADHKRLKLVRVTRCPDGVSPKKNALAMAAQSATGDILLFTDADCVASPGWVTAVNSYFQPETGVVAGFTAYHRVPRMNPFFYGVQAVDFLSHSIVSAAAIGNGLPINANGNNFAIRKSLFDALGGYGRVNAVVSGDDDLILQAASRSGTFTTHFAAELGASVTTEPSLSFRQIFEQRKRWGSKTVYYNRNQVLLLSLIFLYYVLLLLGLVLSPLSGGMGLALACFVWKTGFDFWLFYKGAALFNRTALLPFFPLAALVHIPLIVAACLFGIFGRFTWKDGATRRKADKR